MKQHFSGGRKISYVNLFVKGKVRDFLREMLFQFLRAEMEGVLDVWSAEVKCVFGVQRNGYYRRGLICEYGDLGQIKVPRFRRSVVCSGDR